MPRKGYKKPIVDVIEPRIEFTDDCWLWLGGKDSGGYGTAGGFGAHRVVYEFCVGKIPEGLQLDHLCRNHACVNPDHLEPVTQKVNIQRGDVGGWFHKNKTHCKRGHEFTSQNTYNGTSKIGSYRACKECVRMLNRKYAERKKNESSV